MIIALLIHLGNFIQIFQGWIAVMAIAFIYISIEDRFAFQLTALLASFGATTGALIVMLSQSTLNSWHLSLPWSRKKIFLYRLLLFLIPSLVAMSVVFGLGSLVVPQYANLWSFLGLVGSGFYLMVLVLLAQNRRKSNYGVILVLVLLAGLASYFARSFKSPVPFIYLLILFLFGIIRFVLHDYRMPPASLRRGLFAAATALLTSAVLATSWIVYSYHSSDPQSRTLRAAAFLAGDLPVFISRDRSIELFLKSDKFWPSDLSVRSLSLAEVGGIEATLKKIASCETAGCFWGSVDWLVRKKEVSDWSEVLLAVTEKCQLYDELDRFPHCQRYGRKDSAAIRFLLKQVFESRELFHSWLQSSEPKKVLVAGGWILSNPSGDWIEGNWSETLTDERAIRFLRAAQKKTQAGASGLRDLCRFNQSSLLCGSW